MGTGTCPVAITLSLLEDHLYTLEHHVAEPRKGQPCPGAASLTPPPLDGSGTRVDASPSGVVPSHVAAPVGGDLLIGMTAPTKPPSPLPKATATKKNPTSP